MPTGTVPGDWLRKTTEVILLITGLSPLLQLEHVIYHSVMEHLQQHQILNSFRQGYSCEVQLPSVVEDISHNLSQQILLYISTLL